MITILPKKFIASSYSLQHLGINDAAWTYNDIGNVIEYLAQHNYIILVGDVYRLNGNVPESTYDSWYTNKTNVDNVIAKAKSKAIDYINNYHLRNGDQYLYSLVFEKQL